MSDSTSKLLLPSSSSASAPMLKVDISGAICEGKSLTKSKRYRLQIRGDSLGTMERTKSDYITYVNGSLEWKCPFGESFCIPSTPGGTTIHIFLERSRPMKFHKTVASYKLACSAVHESKEISLPLSSTGQAAQKLSLRLVVSISSVTEAAAVAEIVPPVPKVLADVTNVQDAASTLNDTAALVLPLVSDSLEIVSERLLKLLGLTDQAVELMDRLAEIHPFIKLAWGVVSVVYKVTSEQVKRDQKIEQLASTMAQACAFADEADPLRERSKGHDVIIGQILQQVTQCAYFIKGYWQDESFGMRTMKNIMSGVDKQISDYNESFKALQRSLGMQNTIQCTVTVFRVFDSVKRMDQKVDEIQALQVLDKMNYAPEAHADLKKGCLPGTRTEVIDTIVHWAAQADLPSEERERWTGPVPNPSARVLWVCGMSGAGKSTIIRSVAARLKELGRLGTLYAFSDTTQAITNPGNLFSTIARDLADRDPLRKQRLIDAIKDNAAIRMTTDCSLQFDHFIIAPSDGLATVGDTVVIIDAFDESGNQAARADLLSILTTRTHELPEGLRFIITSRFESDIQAALPYPRPPSLDVLLLEDVPHDLTSRDIDIYVHATLKSVKQLSAPSFVPQFKQLAAKAERSFQWASTACLYITSRADGDGGRGPRDRLRQVLRSNRSLEPLDQLYTMILDRHFQKSSGSGLARLNTILGLTISAQGPLTLRCLVAFASEGSKPAEDILDDYQATLQLLASLLDGTHDVNHPLTVLHTSLADYLQDADRSKAYYVDANKYIQMLAFGCLRVLEDGLKFNICNLPTSYKRNRDFEDIDVRVRDAISPVLAYASQFWPYQVIKLRDVDTIVRGKIHVLLRERVLEWLEAISLLQYSPQDALLQLASSETLPPDLTTLALNVACFVVMFAVPIAQSAAHIYLSALPFAPAASYTRQLSSAFRGTVTLKQGRLTDWPTTVRTLQGHTNTVVSVAFSPDGQQIASSSMDRTIRLWNAKTGVSVGEPMQGHTDDVWAVLFSPDGARLISCSADHTVRIWNSETGDPIGEPLQGHTAAVSAIALSPDGTTIITGSDDKTIRIWDATSGVAIREPLTNHTNDVWAVVFSPDGKLIASGGLDNVICLWDAHTYEAIGEPLEGHENGIRSLVFSPDSTQLVSASDDATIRKWSVPNRALMGSPLTHDDVVASVAYSPNGAQIASASFDGAVRIWDAKGDTDIPEVLYGHSDSVWCIAYSPTGAQVTSGSRDKTVRVWDAKTGVAVGKSLEGHTYSVRCVAYSPDGSRIASASSDETVRLWDAETGALIWEPAQGHTGAVVSISFSFDGKHLASASSDRTIRIWDAETGLAIGSPLEGHTNTVWCVRYSPDGKRIASCSEDATIRFWDPLSGDSSPDPWLTHDSPINSISFSRDGKRLAFGSDDETVRIWDLETRVAIGEPFRGHTALIFSVAFSPDGMRIASGSADNTIRMWDVETGAAFGPPLEGHTDNVASVAFSPDGKRIASCSADSTIRLWDANTGSPIGEPLIGHTQPATSVFFSPDGARIASGSYDKTIRVWDTDADDRRDAPDGSRAIQYPSARFTKRRLLQDGWIVNSDGELLLWVPPSYREGLWLFGCRIFSTPHVTELDFRDFKCGDEWEQCRSTITSSVSAA